MTQLPDTTADEVIDGLDVDAAARLLDVLRSGEAGQALLMDRARQKLLLHRAANAIDRPAVTRKTERLAGRLAGLLDRNARYRWVGPAAAVLLAVGASGLAYGVGRHQDADTFYAFETADSRVLIEADDARDLDLGRPGNAALVSQLSKWVGRPVRVPDLTGSGFRLSEAKLLGAGGMQVAGLVYTGPSGEMMLCLSRDMDGVRGAPEIIQAGGLQAGYWSDGQRTYALLTDKSQKGARQLVAQLSQLTDRLGSDLPPPRRAS